jgi:hypothetical protein
MPLPFAARTLVLVVLALFAGVGASLAQDDEQRRSELGERQRLVERNMAELEARFVRVAEGLQAKEPERAKRLIETLQQAKERLISRRMADVTSLLDAGKLDDAEKELQLLVEDLDQLVRMLLNDQREEMSRAEEIQNLERWKQQIESIRNEQHQQTSETEKIAYKDEALKDLDAKIKQVEQLIADQAEVVSQTEKEAAAGVRALDRIADKQFDLRQRTEALARELAGPPGPETDGESSPENASDKNDEAPSDRPPSNPAEAKAGDAKAGDSKSGEAKAGESKSGEPKTGESPSAPAAGGNPSQPNGADANAGDGETPPRQPGQKPLESAMPHQQAAEEHLTRNEPADAQRRQEKALDEMKAALDELKREQRRIASLSPEALAEMAKRQRQTRGKTMDLAEEMAKAKRPSKSDDGTNDPNQPQPGQRSVQAAEQSMENAAAGLEDKDAQRAERQQAKAEQNLEDALREIEERLNQLREETRQEKLARLESRFNEMLTRQRIATGSTIDLNEKRVNLATWPSREQLSLLRLAAEEIQISELGQQAYDLLLEDGTSAVFPECVLDVRDDLILVAKMLESERTDQLPQLVQRDIEAALEDLIDALKQAKNEGGGGGGGGGGKQPLLRKSAELKMLRAAQMRVNRRTQRFEAIRGQDSLDQQLEQEIKNISDRQSEISQMTEQLMEKND